MVSEILTIVSSETERVGKFLGGGGGENVHKPMFSQSHNYCLAFLHPAIESTLIFVGIK